MAKISATKKIAVEEFPNEVRGWLVRLIQPINKFFEQAYYALAKGLTIADNFKAQKFDIDIAEDQVWPMKVTWSLNERPTMLLLGHIAEARGEAVPTHSLYWVYDNGSIELTISGLLTSSSYKATIVGQV